MNPYRIGTYVGIFVVMLIAVVACNPIQVVDEGHVGLITEFGKAKDDLRTPGLTVINPFTQKLIEVETRVRPIKFADIDAASAEQQSVKLTGTMNFALNTVDIVSLYRRVGTEFQERIVVAALNSTAKEILPQYKVNDILPKRAEISEKIRTRLNEQLTDYGINITAIFLENVAFSKEFQDAIEAKQTAAQTAEKEEQVTIQKMEQAKQREAEGDGEGKAAVARARGQAEANRLVSESLTPLILEDKKLTKWDGKTPLVVSSDGSMIIDIGSVVPASKP
jgi:regulator of protease activity HflC (stomatin/prohibitin superfamily)